MTWFFIWLGLMIAFIASLYFEFKNPGDATTPDEDGGKNSDNID